MTVPAMSIAGANPQRVTTDAEFELGTQVVGREGGVWVYCQANGAITADYVVLLDESQGLAMPAHDHRPTHHHAIISL